MWQTSSPDGDGQLIIFPIKHDPTDVAPDLKAPWLEVQMGSDSDDVRVTVSTTRRLQACVNVVELQLRIPIKIPVQTSGQRSQLTAADAAVIQVEI